MKTLKPILFWFALVLCILSVIGVLSNTGQWSHNPNAAIACAILFCGSVYLLAKYLFEK